MVGGAANAFTTPILLATLGRTVESGRLGRALGFFSAAQALGQLSAPGFGGLLAVHDWRFAYAAVSVVALALCITGIPFDRGTGRRSLRSLADGLTWPVIRIGGAQFASGIGALGIAFLVALHAGAQFDAGPAERGLIVMSGGLASFLTASLAGRAVDRWGAQRIMVVGLAFAALGVTLLPLAQAPWILAPIWALTFAASQMGTIASNAAVLALPNGGAGVSIVQSLRFFGMATAPFVVLPIFNAQAEWGFWSAAAALAVLALVIAATRPRDRPAA